MELIKLLKAILAMFLIISGCAIFLRSIYILKHPIDVVGPGTKRAIWRAQRRTHWEKANAEFGLFLKSFWPELNFFLAVVILSLFFYLGSRLSPFN